MEKIVQVVIEIEKEAFTNIKVGAWQRVHPDMLYKVIENGTVLPKHGRLIDADALIKEYGKYDIGVFVNKALTILEAWGNE